MWMDWEDHLEKILSKKLTRTNNQSEIAACEQKPLPRKGIFVQTPFSHFKMRAKKIHAAQQLAFSLHFLIRLEHNHYSNLTSKIMKMCEQIFKKTAPQYNSNSFNCKKFDQVKKKIGAL